MGNCECGDSKLCGDNQTASALEIMTKGSIYDEQRGKEERSELVLKVRTWQKESYSLFDYENQNHLKEQTIPVLGNGLLVRRSNDIYWVEHGEFQKESEDVFLFQIRSEGLRYRVVNNLQLQALKEQFEDDDNKREQTTKYHNTRRSQHRLEEDEQQSFEEEMQDPSLHSHQLQPTKIFEMGCKVWLVIKSIQRVTGQQGLRLRRGDVIKMGRVKFKIRDINFKTFRAPDSKEMLRRSSSASSQEGPNQCRVCLRTSSTDTNPLVNPCKCAGTMKYIHLECLQHWLRSKLQSNHNDYCLIYMWKNLECELCKFNYPPVFKSDDVFYDLVDLSKPKDLAYMLLEITQKKYEVKANHHPQDCIQQSRDDLGNVNTSNGVYILTFGSKKELRIGRAHETEIRVNDISVSRQHATFKLVDGDVYLCDTKSKFGTLVLMQRQLPLCEQLNGIEVQVSRSVVMFQIGKAEVQHNITQGEFEQQFSIIQQVTNQQDN